MVRAISLKEHRERYERMVTKWDKEIDDALWKVWLEYQRKSKSTGLNEAGYKVLYEWVRKYKPKEVLDCGTGKSTIAIAMGMWYNGFGRVTSMEEIEKWYGMAMERLPEELAPFVEIIHSPVVEYVGGYRYEKVPERPYEMVFIDGPAKTPNLDFVWVVARSKIPVVGIIDKRLGTQKCLGQIYGEKSVSKRIEPSVLHRITPRFAAGLCEDAK